MAKIRNSRGVQGLAPLNSFAGVPMHMVEDIPSGENRYQNLASTVVEKPYPGAIVEYANGQKFMYVKMTGAAAALGSVLMPAAAETTVSNGVTNTDLDKIVTGESWTAGAYVGAQVYVIGGTGEGQCRTIVANDATTLWLDYPLATALSTDSDIAITYAYAVRKVVVEAADTSLSAVAGVSVGVITQNYYGWMQVAGLCQHVLIDDTASVAFRELCADDGTAGTAMAVGANTTVDETLPFGIALAANVSTTIPAILNKCLFS